MCSSVRVLFRVAVWGAVQDVVTIDSGLVENLFVVSTGLACVG